MNDLENGKTIYLSHLNAIREAQQEGRLAIFVGAGASRAENKDYPLWSNICSELLDELHGVDENDSLKIAQRYEIEFTRDRLVDKLRKHFAKKGKTDVFEEILRLNPHCVITTNWDDLFNQAVDNVPSYWNVIANDAELVGLHNEQRIVKMHGDFVHGNIVFTENDYINYSSNFPLIESFVKYILSTHVVVFIGYSFNDPDLKQILNWINKKSVDLPAKYYLNYQTGKEDLFALNNWKKYLASWGLIVLQLENQSILDFLKMVTHSEKLLGGNNNCKEIFLNVCKKYVDLDVVFFASLQEHFSKYLVKTDVLYSEKGFLLVFYINSKTNEKDNVENFKKFFNEIRDLIVNNNSECKENREEILFICEQLSKAGVDGIALNTSSGWGNDIEIWFDNDNTPEVDYCSFEFSTLIKPKEGDSVKKYLEYIYNCIQVGDYFEAKEFCKKAIKLCGEKKDFRSLFICYFNLNHILNFLMIVTPSDETRFRYSEGRIELNKELLQYPSFVRNQLTELNSFFTFEEIYKQSIRMRELREDVEKSIDEKTGKQIKYFSNLGKYMYVFNNLLHFIHLNWICIEKYKEFKILAKDYFNLSFFISKMQSNNEFSLSKIDIYIAIKYFNSDELLKIISENDSKKKIIIKLADNVCDWLVDDVVTDCLNNAEKHRYRTNSYLFEYIQNILIILGRCELNDDLKNRILDELSHFINDINVPISLIEYVSYFFAERYELFDMDFDSLKVGMLMNNFIDKVVYMKASFAEFHSFASTRLNNLYAYLKLSGFEYSDVAEIKKLMTSLGLYTLEDRIDLLQTMVLWIYLISNEECQEEIKNYILKLDYFNIELQKKDLEQRQLEKMICCVLIFHVEEIIELSNENKQIIIEYIKENGNVDGYLKAYYMELCGIPKDKMTGRIRDVILMFDKNINKSEKVE